MFGNKDAGFMEAWRPFRRENGGAIRRKEPAGMDAATPTEALAEKERYFAMASPVLVVASASRWIR